MHGALGFAHATITYELRKAHRALRTDDDGQGTVEYIGLILLLAAVMAVVGAATNGKSIGEKIVGEINQAIDAVSSKKK